MDVCAVVAAGPVHDEISYSNAIAESNIYFILVTFDVSQLTIFWLNFVETRNIEVISVTSDVSQLPMGWLNSEA